MKSDVKPIEKIMVIVEEVPNLVGARIEISFS